MPKLHELKRLRAEKQRAKLEIATKLRAIAEKDEDPTPEEATESDELRSRLAQIASEVAALDVRIGDLEEYVAAQAEAAEEVDALNEEGEGDEGGGGSDDDEERAAPETVRKGGKRPNGNGKTREVDGMHMRQLPRIQPQVRQPAEPGTRAARFVLGVLIAQKQGWRAACNIMQERFGDAEVAKALNTTGTSTGGALIPQAFSRELVELLRATTVVRRLNPTSIPMPGGNLTIPRLAAGASAGYQGELDDITMSQETFDTIQLNGKKLTALVPVSNDLVRRAEIGVEAIIRDDLVQTLARREDLAFLLGDGSGGSPIGMLNQCAASNKLVVAALPTTGNADVLTAVVGTTYNLTLSLEQNMSRMIRPAWIFSPVTRVFLETLRDQVGNFVFANEIQNGNFRGIPFLTSQQIPTNLNTGTVGAPINNGSYLFLADFADMIIADTYNVIIEGSDVASYKDGGGNMVSAFQRDQSVFRVISEHDFAVRHQASLAVAVLAGWAPEGYTGWSGGASYYNQPLNTDSSAAPSTFGTAPPTGSSNPGNVSAAVPGGTLPGRA
jgi:HK97 family phage major capsid protein